MKEITEYVFALKSGYSFTFEIEDGKKYLYIHFGKITQIIEVSDSECRNLARMLSWFGRDDTGNVASTEGE